MQILNSILHKKKLTAALANSTILLQNETEPVTLVQLEPQNISDILVCDDHPFLQAGLEITLRKFLPSQVRIHKALTGKSAVEWVLNNSSELAIVDLELPDCSGIELIKQLQEISPDTRILVLTNCQNPSTLRQITSPNVKAICHKASSLEEFASLFEKIMTSRSVILDPLIQQLLKESSHLQFTPKEMEVLEKIALGYSNQKIADELGCALTTVRFHRANILQKGGFRNAAEVTAWFLKGKSQTDGRS